MKLVACIFILIMGFLTVQPAIDLHRSNLTDTKCCMESCSMEINENPEEKDNCENQDCNPFMSCIYGNYFLSSHTSIYVLPFLISIEKLSPANDNRIINGLSDCWHPPELVIS